MPDQPFSHLCRILGAVATFCALTRLACAQTIPPPAWNPPPVDSNRTQFLPPGPLTLAPSPSLNTSPTQPHRSVSLADRMSAQFGSFRTTSNADRATDSNWVTIELSYSFSSTRRDSLQFIPGIYLEDASTDGKTIGVQNGHPITHGRDFYAVGLDERAHVPIAHGNYAVTAGAGAGLYTLVSFNDYHDNTPQDDSDSNTDSDQRTLATGRRLGYHLFTGINYKSGLYLDFRWYNAGELQGLGYRGTSVSLGFRR